MDYLLRQSDVFFLDFDVFSGLVSYCLGTLPLSRVRDFVFDWVVGVCFPFLLFLAVWPQLYD